MKITVIPDVFTTGETRINESKAKGWFDETAPYTKNRLAIMVYKGNPKKVYTLEDLSKPEIRVSMPNPKWEGIGGNIVKAYNNVGGKVLEETIMVKKVKASTTFLTHIHHRQTPVRIMKGESDAGPVWYTEAYFQKMIGNPIDMVEIPTKDNIVGKYVAGKMKNAPHQEAAKDFFNFLQSEKAGAIYKKYGLLPVNLFGRNCSACHIIGGINSIQDAVKGRSEDGIIVILGHTHEMVPFKPPFSGTEQ